ncbi:MAG: septal ring lytic transglycosylase RlpA family protein [Brevundimonas sp.]|jgi:rare lipoprotein A|uniref:septal ring lytic transglycosylase RlpA family protein n=1 Tax=Brevundimonas sp. TaxID=1871086 RepID=UPI00391D16F3
MTSRSLPSLVISAMSALVVSACASVSAPVGAGAGGAPVRAHAPVRAPIPEVTDPAPIVRGTLRPYQIRGVWYHPAEDPDYDEVGLASWYGDAFHGRPTATGEIFDMHGLSAAHKTLPLPGLVEVTNLENGRTVILRLNDRGPFVEGRIIDLSRQAAVELGLLERGVGRVRVRYVGRAPRTGGGVPAQFAGTPSPQTGAAAQAQPPVQTQAHAAGYWIEAGRYDARRPAERAARRLGQQARVDEFSRGAYRVLVGPWDDPNRAEQARQAVIARGYPQASLLPSR